MTTETNGFYIYAHVTGIKKRCRKESRESKVLYQGETMPDITTMRDQAKAWALSCFKEFNTNKAKIYIKQVEFKEYQDGVKIMTSKLYDNRDQVISVYAAGAL